MGTAEADRRERDAITEGLDQLRQGWTPNEVLVVLTDAWLTIQDLRAPICDWCERPVVKPVRDAEEVSWRRSQARMWCCVGCQALRYEAEIDAAGNEAS